MNAIENLKLAQIYMPLVGEYLQQYFEDNSLNNGEKEYKSKYITECNDEIRFAIHKAYLDGLHEGLNNGFIEGFCKYHEKYKNIKF